VKVVCISDTHNQLFSVPDGDLLIVAGDATLYGTAEELVDFNHWLGTLPHPHKVMVAGNHDELFQSNPELARLILTNAIYLEDSGYQVGALKIWGSPWQPAPNNAGAFNLPIGDPLRQKWARIPTDTDVLITHTPPMFIRDISTLRRHQGCEALFDVVTALRPRLHVFGHIHEGAGRVERGHTIFVNAAICDALYDPVNPVQVVEL
jgi:Icc-related predicted phosphoesterase